MISRLKGTLVSQRDEWVEVATAGGVTYEIEVPLSVAQELPGIGKEVELRIVHMQREDGGFLYGFLTEAERRLFSVLLVPSGIGGRIAVAMLSTFPAARLARALVEKDIPALVQVPGIGKKTAERIVLELSERVAKLDFGGEVAIGRTSDAAQAAVRALVALGMSTSEAERAVRTVLATDEGPDLGPDELIRRALAER